MLRNKYLLYLWILISLLVSIPLFQFINFWARLLLVVFDIIVLSVIVWISNTFGQTAQFSGNQGGLFRIHRDKLIKNPGIFAASLIFLILFCYLAHRLYSDMTFRQYARKTQGVVVDKFHYDTRDSHGKYNKHYITYQFIVGAAHYRKTSRILENWSDLSIGSPVPVYYSVNNPNVNRLDLNSESNVTIAVIILGIAFFLLFLSLAMPPVVHHHFDIRAYWRRKHQKWLKKDVEWRSQHPDFYETDPRQAARDRVMLMHSRCIDQYAKEAQISSEDLWKDISQLFIFNKTLEVRAYFDYLLDIFVVSGKMDSTGLTEEGEYCKSAQDVLQLFLQHVASANQPRIIGSVETPIQAIIYHL